LGTDLTEAGWNISSSMLLTQPPECAADKSMIGVIRVSLIDRLFHDAQHDCCGVEHGEIRAGA
jgi:hypothetical protein